MSSRRRLLALTLCLGMLLVLTASSACILHDAGHCCVGDGCEICKNIARITSQFRVPAFFGLLCGLSVFLPDQPFASPAGGVRRRFDPSTLVSWKIRLND